MNKISFEWPGLNGQRLSGDQALALVGAGAPDFPALAATAAELRDAGHGAKRLLACGQEIGGPSADP